MDRDHALVRPGSLSLCMKFAAATVRNPACLGKIYPLDGGPSALFELSRERGGSPTDLLLQAGIEAQAYDQITAVERIAAPVRNLVVTERRPRFGITAMTGEYDRAGRRIAENPVVTIMVS